MYLKNLSWGKHSRSKTPPSHTCVDFQYPYSYVRYACPHMIRRVIGRVQADVPYNPFSRWCRPKGRMAFIQWYITWLPSRIQISGGLISVQKGATPVKVKVGILTELRSRSLSGWMAHNNPSFPGQMNKVIKQRDTNRDHVILPQNIPLHHPPSLPSCRTPKHHRHPATSEKCRRHAYSSHCKLRRNPATTFPLDHLGVVATQLHLQRIPLKQTST